MALRFHRSIKLLADVRLNIGKHGIGISAVVPASVSVWTPTARHWRRGNDADARVPATNRATKDHRASSLFPVVAYRAPLPNMWRAPRHPAHSNSPRRLLLWGVLPSMSREARGEGMNGCQSSPGGFTCSRLT